MLLISYFCTFLGVAAWFVQPGNESSRFSLATSKCGRRQLSCQWTLSWKVSIDIYCIYTFKLSRLSFAFETRKIVSPWCGVSATKSTIEANLGPWRQFRWKIPQLGTLLRKDSKACFNASWKSCRRCNKSWFLVIERLHNLAAIEI